MNLVDKNVSQFSREVKFEEVSRCWVFGQRMKNLLLNHDVNFLQDETVCRPPTPRATALTGSHPLVRWLKQNKTKDKTD